MPEAARRGFDPPGERDFASAWPFTPTEHAAFLMTESSVVAAVERGGETDAAVGAWLETELAGPFGHEARRVAFGGYIQALRRL
jgi:hypothetical protein